MPLNRSRGLFLVVFLGFLLVFARAAWAAPPAQDPVAGEQVFNAKCVACHTLGGGRLVGPDLKGVSARRDPAWLKQFIAAPDEVLASGDPVAAQMLAEYNNVPMPNLGLTAAEVDDILAFLATHSDAAATGTADAVQPVPAQPAGQSAGDPQQGEAYFTGQARLELRGTACIACHSVEGVGLLGGGALGPDLTHVYTRYGEQGLAAALNSLPFPSMQGIFATRALSPDEQAALLGFFAEADTAGDPQTERNLRLALGIGITLAALLFLGMAIYWPRQRLSIAQRLRRDGRL